MKTQNTKWEAPFYVKSRKKVLILIIPIFFLCLLMFIFSDKTLENEELSGSILVFSIITYSSILAGIYKSKQPDGKSFQLLIKEKVIAKYELTEKELTISFGSFNYIFSKDKTDFVAHFAPDSAKYFGVFDYKPYYFIKKGFLYNNYTTILAPRDRDKEITSKLESIFNFYSNEDIGKKTTPFLIKVVFFLILFIILSFTLYVGYMSFIDQVNCSGEYIDGICF